MEIKQRLIDANKIKYQTIGAGGWNQPENVVSDYEIEKMPTVDAVEVVRCKDCKHRYLNKHGEPCCEIWAHNRDTVVRDYDFCSYGKRKINV